MRVVSIDPAPSSNNVSTVYDGETFLEIPTHRMRGFLDDLGPETLLCWDAPLTGPQDPTRAGEHKQDFTKRVIEAFFTKGKTGFETPEGIWVGGYSDLSHWTISRSVLGLPRVGPYCADYDDLPFQLLPDPHHRRMRRPPVAETHPAVAAWLWCRDEPEVSDMLREDDEGKKIWRYKGTHKDKNPELMCKMWEVIRTQVGWPVETCPESDDEFDAGVGYLLGQIYLRDRYRQTGDPKVAIVGSRETGAWLLPMAKGLKEAWNKFWPGEEQRRNLAKQ